MTDTPTEVKGCPFCCKEPTVSHSSEGVQHVIECEECQILFGDRDWDRLLKDWNTRHGDADLKRLIDGVQAVIDDTGSGLDPQYHHMLVARVAPYAGQIGGA